MNLYKSDLIKILEKYPDNAKVRIFAPSSISIDPAGFVRYNKNIQIEKVTYNKQKNTITFRD